MRVKQERRRKEGKDKERWKCRKCKWMHETVRERNTQTDREMTGKHTRKCRKKG